MKLSSKTIKHFAFVFSVAVCLPVLTYAESERLHGRIVGVSDGDTVTLLDINDHQHKIRLAQIDAPEKAQDYGNRSKQNLSDLAFGRDVSVEVVDTDRYQRKVGTIFVGPLNVNQEQVRMGMAWVYRRYAKDERLLQLEVEARQRKAGLWADPSPTPPWEFRRRR